MANTQRPGFLPSRTVGTSHVQKRVRAADNGSRIRKGDLLLFSGATYALQTATNTANAGASLGCSYVADGVRIESPVLPVSTNYADSGPFGGDESFLYIAEGDHNVIYIASVDEAITDANVQLNHSQVLGTTAPKYSDHEIDATSPNTTNTLPIRIIGFVESTESDPALADAHVYCQMNDHLAEPALDTTGTS